MTKRKASALAEADRADAAADIQQTGSTMSNIRTANKRHKRALTLAVLRAQAEKVPAEKTKPAKAAA